MTLYATIYNRDFSTQPIRPLDLRVNKLTWSAFGGPDEAILSAGSTADRLLEYASLLRCPIMIAEDYTTPSWWGFIDRITIRFESFQYEIDLDNLYNWVKVKYSFISPDNKLSEQYETTPASNAFSYGEYGYREIVLYRKNIDDDFAINLRDTFLKTSSFPQVIFTPNAKPSKPFIQLHCSGWFSTFNWLSYTNFEGFYANHGPGPGMVASGNGTISNVAQSFYTGSDNAVKYVYFLLRKVGSPTSTIYARIYSDSGSDTPNAILATSVGFNGALLRDHSYSWVKFTFTTPFSLSAGTKYWVVFYPNTSSSSNFYQLRIDENMNYPQYGYYGRQYSGGAWNLITSVTNPGSKPDLYFRVVCLQDTGSQLLLISTTGNQFFSAIDSITSGINTSPYRYSGFTCFKEIIDLMHLGTVNQRLILASVSPSRRLTFYEQPDPNVPTVYLDRQGRFFTKDQKLIQPYFPPIGQFAAVSGIDRLSMPFDRHRIPTYFVDQASYTP
jgi:hypothetical protein